MHTWANTIFNTCLKAIATRRLERNIIHCLRSLTSRVSLGAHADETTILKAKRTKLLACHPDKVGVDAVGAGHAVGRITAALDVLTSPTERKRYDAQLRADERAEQPSHERPSGSAQSSAPSEDAIYFPSSR